MTYLPQSECPHPPEQIVRAEAWGWFGAWFRCIRCRLCGATR